MKENRNLSLSQTRGPGDVSYNVSDPVEKDLKSSTSRAEVRKQRYAEQQSMINAIEETDNMIQMEKTKERIAKQERVLSLSKERRRGESTGRQSETMREASMPSLSNQRKPAEEPRGRPQTAAMATTAPAQMSAAAARNVSQERLRFEKKQKREQALEMARLEEEQEMIEEKMRVERHLAQTEKFLERQGRSLSPNKRGKEPEEVEFIENDANQGDELNMASLKSRK